MLADVFIRRPVLSTVCSLLIILAGAVSIPTLPIARYPNLAPPSLVVTAVYFVIRTILMAPFEFEGSDLAPNPIPTKALLKVLGLPGGDCRSPMGPEPDDLADRARQVLAGLGRPV